MRLPCTIKGENKVESQLGWSAEDEMINQGNPDCTVGGSWESQKGAEKKLVFDGVCQHMSFGREVAKF